jgi:hypothetical protein
MPGKNLTTASQIMCPHGGRATLLTTNTKVFADNALVLLESDVHPVVGCPFTVGPKYSPCVRIEWSAGSTKVTVNSTATLVKTSIGKCMNAEGAPQGIATIVNTQTQVEAQ